MNDLFDALVSLDASLPADVADPDLALDACLAHLPTVLPCRSYGLVGIDEATMLPQLTRCHPPEAQAALAAQLHQVAQLGLFRLALSRNQPVQHELPDGLLLLHAIATRSHLAGVLLAVVSPDEALPTHLAALTLALTRTAGAHETLLLQRRLHEHNRSLEATVRERTAELQQARDRAEASSRAKSSFLATMSHELRTPLNGILGMADLLADPARPPEEAQRLAVIRACAEDLLAHIDGILDLSRVEAGRLDIEPGDVDLTQLLDQVVATLTPVAARKGLALGWERGPGFPARIRSDGRRLRQVIANLGANAVKFTERGSVRITATYADGVLAIAVHDTGLGMTPEVVARLFTPFEQGDASINRRFGGTGLGLVISRRICELLGGTITITSTPGVGTTCTASIRCPVLAEADRTTTPTQAGQHDWSQARVLAADDQLVNRLVLTGMLRRHGITATVVEGGAQVIAAAQSQPWDLVLVDLQMPEIDGFQVVERLRAAGNSIPIIAVTAHAMAGDRDECLRRGFTDHLAKPVRPDALTGILERWLSPAPPAAARPPRPPALAALAEAVGDDCLRLALTTFRSEGARLVAETIAAVQAGDLRTVAKRGHTLKGDAGNFGLDRLVALAAELEQAARAEDADRCQAAVTQLEPVWTEAEAFLAGQH